MPHLLEDQNRRDLTFFKAKVKDILPEFYQTEYPDFIVFLEKYYEFLENDNSHSFSKDIESVLSIRDISETSQEGLDGILSEIGDGLTVASFFKQPRLMMRLLADFYKVKGTLVSAEGFFRSFFNEEVTIEYPKRQILTINDADNNFLDHKIGYESQKFIQDAGIYQVFSILVKVGVSVADYESLYKKFVHPAGWHFTGEVATESEIDLLINGIGLNPLESDGNPLIASEINLNIVHSPTQLTGLLESDGTYVRTNLVELVSDYQDIPTSILNTYYDNTLQIISPNSFTFDDSDTVTPDMALTTETMDNTIFTRYTSDSSI